MTQYKSSRKQPNLIRDTFGPKHLGLYEVTFVPPDIPQVEDFFVAGDRAGAYRRWCSHADQQLDIVHATDRPRGATRKLGDARQRTLKVVIVAVEIADDVAGRSLYALVDRVRLATVLLAHPISDADSGIFELLRHFHPCFHRR